MFSRKEFTKIFIPVLIEQILMTTIGIVNTMMVSGISMSAISAVSLIDSINYVIMNLFTSFATGGTVVVAQRIGAKDMDGANETSAQAMTVCVLSALLSGFAVIVFGPQIIELLFSEADAQIKSYALIYLKYSGLSYPFLAAYTMAAGILRASGNTRAPMRASILSNIVNIGIGAFCIFVLGFGVAGAGLALLCSRISCSLMLAFVVLRPEVGKAGIRKISFKFNKAILLPVLSIGLPACIDGLIFNGGKLGIQSLITSLGTVSIAANSIANSVNTLTCIPGSAMSIVAITVVGQAVGSGVYGKNLRKVIISLNVYSIVLITAITIIVFPLLPFIVDLYKPLAEVKAMTIPVLKLSSILMPVFWPLAFNLSACIRSTGDSSFVTLISVLSMWFIRFMGAWVSVNYTSWGLMGVWVFWCMDWVVRSIVFTIRTKVSPYINKKDSNIHDGPIEASG